MKLKDQSGWFAAGHGMLEALALLSDGAFKLFVFICLQADRRTGRFYSDQGSLARATAKSRRSIAAYLDELARHGVCRLTPAANQHQSGWIEISDRFWPYEKEITSDNQQASHRRTGDQASGRQADEQRVGERQELDYIQQVRSRFLAYPIIQSGFTESDRRVAAQLYRQKVSLDRLDRALLVGVARKYISHLNALSSSPIYSLRYFLPLLDEVAYMETPAEYWAYLRRRVADYQSLWLDQCRSTSPSHQSAAARKPSVAVQQSATGAEGG
jgi:hypothetical protein